MTQLTDGQIAAFAAGAGFSGPDLPICVAVCIAESGGKTDDRSDIALEDATWGPSVGLMQIRSLKAQHGSGGERDELANLDPATNMNHAHSIWSRSGWKPWSTFNTGVYRLYMGRAQNAAATASTANAAAAVGLSSGGGGTAAAPAGSAAAATLVDFATKPTGPIPLPWDLVTIPGDLAGGVGVIAAGMVKTAHWLSDRRNWIRVGYVTIGVLGVVGGLYMIARPVVQPVVDKAQEVGQKAAKAAEVAAVA